MASTQDLAGREVYDLDGEKVGQVKELVYDGEFAVVRRSLFAKLVVPLDALRDMDGRLTIPLHADTLHNAPRVDPKYPLSPKDKAYLEHFYGRKAA